MRNFNHLILLYFFNFIKLEYKVFRIQILYVGRLYDCLHLESLLVFFWKFEMLFSKKLNARVVYSSSSKVICLRILWLTHYPCRDIISPMSMPVTNNVTSMTHITTFEHKRMSQICLNLVVSRHSLVYRYIWIKTNLGHPFMARGSSWFE